MTSKMKVAFISIILGGLSIWLWNTFSKSNILFDKIYFGSLFLIILFLAINVFLELVKDYLIFKQIYFLFERINNIIFTLVVCLKIFDPLFVFILMFIIQCSLLRLGLFIFGYSIKPEIIYFAFVITIILFAYKGVYLTYLYQKFFKSDKEIYTIIGKLTVKMVYKINFRRRIYEIMILMYILFSIEKLSANFNIENIYWTNYSKISLEILLTFVVIDGYVNAFMPEVIDKERKQYYSLDQECE